MSKRTTQKIPFSKQGRREIEAIFNGGNISSDGGVLLLREADRRERLTIDAAKALKDLRARVCHQLEVKFKSFQGVMRHNP